MVFVGIYMMSVGVSVLRELVVEYHRKGDNTWWGGSLVLTPSQPF